MKRALMTAGVLALALATSGCLSGRVIRTAREHGTRNITLMQTQDTYTYVPGFFYMTKHQFWACKQDAETLTCRKACDSESTDLDCPPSVPGGTNNQVQ